MKKIAKTSIAAVAVAALGGAGTAALTASSATAAKDPCAASEVARTVGKVIYSTGDYLDSHPETNDVLTGVLQQTGPQSLGALSGYLDANPKVQSDLAKVTEPLAGLAGKCKLTVNLPQLLGLLQAAQGTAPPAPAQSPSMVIS